jgi:superfamily II DNA/RNA helicase
LLAIIIAPTRELAAQIHEVLERLAKPFAWIVGGLITGGMARNKEVCGAGHDLVTRHTTI